MVARGDLGLECPLEHVPGFRRRSSARRVARCPAIVATQVLESMRTEPRPTRAEVSDAATAVDQSADAIMLAGKTAIGEFPGPGSQNAPGDGLPKRNVCQTGVDGDAIGSPRCGPPRAGNLQKPSRWRRRVRPRPSWRSHREGKPRLLVVSAATRADSRHHRRRRRWPRPSGSALGHHAAGGSDRDPLALARTVSTCAGLSPTAVVVFVNMSMRIFGRADANFLDLRVWGIYDGHLASVPLTPAAADPVQREAGTIMTAACNQVGLVSRRIDARGRDRRQPERDCGCGKPRE